MRRFKAGEDIDSTTLRRSGLGSEKTDEVRPNRGKEKRHDDRLVVEGFDAVDEVQVKGVEGRAVVVWG